MSCFVIISDTWHADYQLTSWLWASSKGDWNQIWEEDESTQRWTWSEVSPSGLILMVFQLTVLSFNLQSYLSTYSPIFQLRVLCFKQDRHDYDIVFYLLFSNCCHNYLFILPSLYCMLVWGIEDNSTVIAKGPEFAGQPRFPNLS